MLKRCLKINILLIIPIVAFIGVGCIEAEFSVSAVTPSNHAENVSRTTAVLLTILAASDIRSDQLTSEYFKLEDMGRDYQAPTTSSSSTSSSSTPPSSTTSSDKKTTSTTDDSTKPATTSEQKTTDSSTRDSGTLIPAAVYIYSRLEGMGKERDMIEFRLAISPTVILAAQHTFRFTMSETVEDNEKNKLSTDYVSYFKTGNLPDVKGNDANLIKSAPINFLAPLSTTPDATTDETKEDSKTSEEKSDKSQERSELTDNSHIAEISDSGTTDENKPPTSDSTESTTEDKETAPEPTNTETEKSTEKADDKLLARGILIHPEQSFLFTFDAPIIPTELRRRIIIRTRDLTRTSAERIDYTLYMIEDPTKPNQRFQKYLVEPNESLSGTFSFEVMRKNVTLRSETATEAESIEKQPLYIERNEFKVDLEESLGQNQRETLEE